MLAIIPDLFAGLARTGMTEASVHVRRCCAAESGSCSLFELVALIHAHWWDFEVVLGFECPVRWCCACWESFGLEFGDFVVADEDAWGVLFAC